VIITRDILKSLIKEELSKVNEISAAEMQMYFKNPNKFKEDHPEKAEKLASNFKAGRIPKTAGTYKLAQSLSNLNESLDVDTLENLEASVTPELANAVMIAYKEMTTPTDVDQVYANTGDPVSKDPQDMHDKAVEIIGEIIFDQSKKTDQDEMALNEDGHSDVPSAVRAMKTIIEDAGQMLQTLEQMGEGSLPTWWTNKMAVSASMMNKMRDYLLYPKTMDEGFMDAVKRKIGTMPDDRSTVEKIKSHPEMRGRDKLGPARGPIMSVIEKYASEEEMETILSALEQPAGAAVGLPMKESKD